MVSRRAFLMAVGLNPFWGSGGVPGFVARAASQSKSLFPYKKNHVMAVTPFTDPFLKDSRPHFVLKKISLW